MANVKFSQLPSASTVTPADTFAVVQGGTSKQSSLANLWEATPVGNLNYNIAVTDVLVYTSVAFTGAHTWTLPTAANYGAGRILRVVDSLSTLTSVNALTLARNGTDTIGGLASIVLSQAGQAVLLVSDGNATWSVVGQGIAAVGNSYQAINVSAAGNTNSNQGAVSNHFINLLAAAGAAPYTATLSLPYPNIAAGDAVNIHLNCAASTNPKVQIFDNNIAGTKLFEWNGDGTLTDIALVCVFNGSAWYLHDAHFFA